MDRCPSAFMDALAQLMVTQACDVAEEIVSLGEYGKHFGIVLQGSVELCEKSTRSSTDEQNAAVEGIEVEAQFADEEDWVLWDDRHPRAEIVQPNRGDVNACQWQ